MLLPQNLAVLDVYSQDCDQTSTYKCCKWLDVGAIVFIVSSQCFLMPPGTYFVLVYSFENEIYPCYVST